MELAKFGCVLPVDSIYIRLGFRLQGSSCVFVEAHHLHRPRAHLGSLCRFKAFPKAGKVESGQVAIKASLSSEVKAEMIT